MLSPALTSSPTVTDRITAASRRPAGLGAVPAGAISLAMGEPDADTSPAITAAAVTALRAGRTRYEALTGAPALRSALAEHITAGTGRPTSAAEVVTTHGGSAGLAATMLALLSPGDRVIVPEPTYSLYTDHLAMIGAEQVWLAPTPTGRIDLVGLRALAADARMLVLCNPANPTGAVHTAAELAEIAEIVAAHPSLILVSDEAYCDIVFDGADFLSAAALPGIREQVVLVGTFSKSYAMTGWRLGYVVANEEHAARINLVHRTLNGALSTFVQDAGLVALRTPPGELARMRDTYQRRRDLVVRHLDGIPGIDLARPAGAFYAFPRVHTDVDSQTLVQRLAEGGVLLRAGSEYGPSGEGHVRLSFASDEAHLEEGLRRFVDVARRLIRE